MRPAQWFRIVNKRSISLPYQNNFGFTLIEILVVVAIIGILTGGAISAYTNFNRAQTVKRAAFNLVADIRDTQNKAVAGLKHEDCTVDDFPPSPPPGGDHIDDYQLRGHYLIFSTTIPPTPPGTPPNIYQYQKQESCVEALSSGQDLTSNETIYRPTTPEPETLLTGITIKNSPSQIYLMTFAGGSCGADSLSQLTINFLPLGGVNFHLGIGIDVATSPLADSSCLRARIDIWDGTTTYRIEVDKSGQVTQRKV